MKFKILPKIITTLVVISLSYYCYATDVANRTVNATNLLNNFSTLNNSVTGQQILKQNLATSRAVNNDSSEAQRQQAIYDYPVKSKDRSIGIGNIFTYSILSYLFYKKSDQLKNANLIMFLDAHHSPVDDIHFSCRGRA